jgi:PAS domain-containing protein
VSEPEEAGGDGWRPAPWIEIRIDADGRYVGANAYALEVLDYTLDELCALPLGSLSGNDPDQARVLWRLVQRGEVTFPAPRAGEMFGRGGRVVSVIHFSTQPVNGDGEYIARSRLRAPDDPTIHPSLPSILREWRRTEWLVKALPPGDPERLRLQTEVERLRLLFQREADRRSPGE